MLFQDFFTSNQTARNLDDAAEAKRLFADCTSRPSRRKLVRSAGQPAYLTNLLLRPTMHRTQLRFLPSGCSTDGRVRLRVAQVENTTGHGTSPPS